MAESAPVRDPSTLFDVRNKRCLVTGGSRGIGSMIAEGLVRAGADVLICSRKAEACMAEAERLSAIGRCQAIVADLATEQGVDAVHAAVAAGPGLDVLVNNAGATWGAPLEEHPLEAMDKVWTVNVRAVFELTRRLLGPLRARAEDGRPSRVINIGSMHGSMVPRGPTFGYAASKAAVHMLTRHLSVELAPSITVNAIAPGFFETDMTAFMLRREGMEAKLRAGIPLGRIGRPEDIVGLVLFLASDAGSFVTGAVIPLDGGASNPRL